jgi:hypothetical protein
MRLPAIFEIDSRRGIYVSERTLYFELFWQLARRMRPEDRSRSGLLNGSLIICSLLWSETTREKQRISAAGLIDNLSRSIYPSISLGAETAFVEGTSGEEICPRRWLQLKGANNNTQFA